MTAPPAPMRVLRLDHVVLRVADLARAEAFYTAVLGASVERRIDKPIVLVQLRIGESLLDLVPGRKPEEAAHNVEHFCMRVEPFDAEAIAAHVRRHGGEPEEPRELYGADGFGTSIYFRDLDGNRVELKGPPTRQLHESKP
ncbi:MAG: lactoylglutathione lyase [Betaproteobacteria bacterium]|nr:lactoylglutathione lyase [Betaproteobacteria bacterium]